MRCDVGSGDVLTFSFVSPRSTQRMSYSRHKQRLTSSLRHHSATYFYDNGLLLSTLEKGVMFPIIHMKEDDVDGHDDDDEELKSTSLDDDLVLQRGKYKEIKRMCHDSSASARLNGTIRPSTIEREPSYSSLDRKMRDGPVLCPEHCIMMGFKRLDTYFSEVLEESWVEWTGVRFIYLNINDDFGLKSVRFLRRVRPNDINMFMYIVIAECTNISDSNRLAFMDFIQRFRVDKMTGYVSVYERYNDNETERADDYEKRPSSTDQLIDGVNGIVVHDRHNNRKSPPNYRRNGDNQRRGSSPSNRFSRERQNSDSQRASEPRQSPPGHRRYGDTRKRESLPSNRFQRERENNDSRRTSEPRNHHSPSPTRTDDVHQNRRQSESRSMGVKDISDEMPDDSRRDSYAKTDSRRDSYAKTDSRRDSYAKTDSRRDSYAKTDSTSVRDTRRHFEHRRSSEANEYQSTLPVTEQKSVKKLTTRKHSKGKAFKVLS